MATAEKDAFNCRKCKNETRKLRGCRYPLRPRDIGPRIRRMVLEDELGAEAIHASLRAEGSAQPIESVDNWVKRIKAANARIDAILSDQPVDQEPLGLLFGMPGDTSLSVEDAAAYPDLNEPVTCERYELEHWASQAVYVYGLFEKGAAGLDDLDPWHAQAIGIVGVELGEVYRKKRQQPEAGADG